jgi:signal transduction histidine kinase
MAAHDLNNPLTVILGCGEIILESLANESPDFKQVFIESVETMRRQAWAMGRLLSDILGFSRIQQGKLSLELGPAAINEVVAARLEAHETLARRKGISVRTDLKEGLPVVAMDVERIGEAVDNLLSNAVKYSRLGGEVWIKTAASAGGGVLIEVEDTGAGIAQQDFPKLFREFSRLGNKPTGGEGSTGMGLAIVKKIVELHGGDVRVSSLPGRGSTFGFTLPRPQAAEPSGNDPWKSV